MSNTNVDPDQTYGNQSGSLPVARSDSRAKCFHGMNSRIASECSQYGINEGQKINREKNKILISRHAMPAPIISRSVIAARSGVRLCLLFIA